MKCARMPTTPRLFAAIAFLSLPALAGEPTDDFCEYSVDGGAPQRGTGGISNVMSIHWMGPKQPGRSIATPLLINCGPAGAQLNFDTVGNSTETDIPRKPGTFKMGFKHRKATFGVRGNGFMAGDGELTISTWDAHHVVGTFTFTANGKKYAGKFDLKCPYGSNGVCQ